MSWSGFHGPDLLQEMGAWVSIEQDTGSTKTNKNERQSLELFSIYPARLNQCRITPVQGKFKPITKKTPDLRRYREFQYVIVPGFLAQAVQYPSSRSTHAIQIGLLCPVVSMSGNLLPFLFLPHDKVVIA